MSSRLLFVQHCGEWRGGTILFFLFFLSLYAVFSETTGALQLKSSVPYPITSYMKSAVEDPCDPLKFFVGIKSMPYSSIVRGGITAQKKPGSSTGVTDIVFLNDGESEMGELFMLERPSQPDGSNTIPSWSLIVPVYHHIRHQLILVHFEVTEERFTRLEDVIVDGEDYDGPISAVTVVPDPKFNDLIHIVHVDGDALRVLTHLKLQLAANQSGSGRLSKFDIIITKQNTLPRVVPLVTDVDEGCHLIVGEDMFYFVEKYYPSAEGPIARSFKVTPERLATVVLRWSRNFVDTALLTHVFQNNINSVAIVVQFDSETALLFGSPSSLPGSDSMTMIEGSYIGNTFFSMDKRLDILYIMNQALIDDEDDFGIAPAYVRIVDYYAKNITQIGERYEGEITFQVPFYLNENVTGLAYGGYTPNFFDNQGLYLSSVATDGALRSKDLGTIAGTQVCSFYSHYYNQFFYFSGIVTAKFVRYDKTLNRVETRIMDDIFNNMQSCEIDQSGKYAWIAASNLKHRGIIKLDLQSLTVVATQAFQFVQASFVIATDEYIIVGANFGSSLIRMPINNLTDVSLYEVKEPGLLQYRSVFLSKDKQHLFIPIRSVESGISIYPMSIKDFTLLPPTRVLDPSSRMACVIHDTQDRFFIGVNKDTPTEQCSIISVAFDRKDQKLKLPTEYHVSMDKDMGIECQVLTCFQSNDDKYGYFATSHKYLLAVDLSQTKTKMTIIDRLAVNQEFKSVKTSSRSAFVMEDGNIYLFDIFIGGDYSKERKGIMYLIVGCSVGGIIIACGVLIGLVVAATRHACCTRNYGKSKYLKKLSNDIQMQQMFLLHDDIPDLAMSHETSL